MARVGLCDRDEPCLLTTVRIQNKSVAECELSASLNFKADVYAALSCPHALIWYHAW